MPKVDGYSWKRDIQQKFNKTSKMPSGQIENGRLIGQYNNNGSYICIKYEMILKK